MKSNPHCYYSIILFQLSTQFFCNHFTSSFLSLLGALGIMVSDAHLLTPLLVRCQGPKLGGSRLSLWNLHRAWVGWWQSLSGGGMRVSLGITSSQLTHLSFGAFRWALSVEKQRRAKDFRTRGRHLSDHPLQTLCFSFLLFHNIISPKCIGRTATTIYLLMTAMLSGCSCWGRSLFLVLLHVAILSPHGCSPFSCQSEHLHLEAAFPETENSTYLASQGWLRTGFHHILLPKASCRAARHLEERK